MRTAINPMGDIDMAKDYIIDYGTFPSINGWWRKWKSGFIEQGGFYNAGTGYGSFTVTLIIPMTTTIYGAWIESHGGEHDYGHYVNSKTTISFSGLNRQYRQFYWHVSGY